MPYIKNLQCKECKTSYEEELISICTKCFGALDVQYNLEKISNNISPNTIEQRTKSIWRYNELLPVDLTKGYVNIKAGHTPLKKSNKLGEKIGLKNLYIKDDTVNPTGSFKDRPASVAVTKAKEYKLSAVGCASTGNLAGATAAAASNLDIPSYIFIPRGLANGKVLSALAYGGNVIEVDGTYDRVNRIATFVSDKKSWGLVNINLRTFYVEGSKTLAYEICEQLNWKSPDHVIVPLGSGALLCAVSKALNELEVLNWVNTSHTKISGSQPIGCAPIVNAFENKLSYIQPVEKPSTIAKSLAIGDPASGNEANQIIQGTGGWAHGPTDQEIVESQILLAQTEGILAEPAGGSVLASLLRKVEDGEIENEETVVLCITGSGLKSLSSIESYLNKPVRSLDIIEKELQITN